MFNFKCLLKKRLNIRMRKGGQKTTKENPNKIKKNFFSFFSIIYISDNKDHVKPEMLSLSENLKGHLRQAAFALKCSISETEL